MFNKKFFILLFYFLTFLFSYSLYAKVGSTGWIIFRKAQSPKPKPVTSVAAIRGDLSGVLYNPSVLATIEQREIFTIAEVGLTEDKIAAVIYGQPLGKIQALSVGILTYNAGKMSLYWIEDGQEKEREVNAQNDFLGIISYGRKITDKLHIGATTKFATSNIAETSSAMAYAIDLGLSYYLTNNLVVSAAGQNLGFSTKFLDKDEKLPASIWTAVGYSGVISSLGQNFYYVVGADIPYIIDEQRIAPSIGVEVGRLPISIFFGYRINVEEGVFNIGLLFIHEKFDISYSYIPATYLSQVHRLSLGFRF
jgi:hypothetical protein